MSFKSCLGKNKTKIIFWDKGGRNAPSALSPPADGCSSRVGVTAPRVSCSPGPAATSTFHGKHGRFPPIPKTPQQELMGLFKVTRKAEEALTHSKTIKEEQRSVPTPPSSGLGLSEPSWDQGFILFSQIMTSRRWRILEWSINKLNNHYRIGRGESRFLTSNLFKHHDHWPLIRDLREMKHVQTCPPFIHPPSLQYFLPYFLLRVPVVIKRVLQFAHRTTYQPAGCSITKGTTLLFQQHQLPTPGFYYSNRWSGRESNPGRRVWHVSISRASGSDSSTWYKLHDFSQVETQP